MLFVIGGILLPSLSIRYPLLENERFQSDSYFIHILADSIVEDGRAKWTFNPLSYVGYYPFSYPSGVPFLLAELSELTGLQIEICVLLTDMILAILFCLGGFLLARQFIIRPEFVLLAVLFTVLGPRFVDTTYWDASARGPLIVFLTLAVLTASRGAAMGHGKLFAIAFAFGAVTFALHHMAVLLVLFGISYLIATFQSRYLLPRIMIRRRQAAAVINSLFIICVFVVTYVLFNYLVSPEYTGLNEGSLFDFEIPMLTTFANLAASYTNQIGFILPVAVLSIVSLFRRSQFSLSNIFLFSVLVAFIPLLDRALYVTMVLTPFVAILGTLGIRNLAASSKRKFMVIFLVVVLVASSIFLPVWSNARWNHERYLTGDTVAVDNQAFNDASYLRATYPGTFAMSNNNIGSMVLFACSDTGFLGSGIMLAINGDITEQDIENVTFSDADFPTNLYIWFEYPSEPRADVYVLSVYVKGMNALVGPASVEASAYYFSRHSRLLVLVDNDLPSKYANQYGVIGATLPEELLNAEWQGRQPSESESSPMQSYMIYQSAGQTVYIFEAG